MLAVNPATTSSDDCRMTTASQTALSRRTVFYIGGYDPRGPAHYHGLYRDEAAKQAKVSGFALTVGPKSKIDAISTRWKVTSPATETDYIFLRYDDIVRQRWSRTNIAVLRDILDYTWEAIRSGVLAGGYKLSRPMFMFSLFAPSLVAIAAMLAILAGILAGSFVSWWLAAPVVAAVFAGCIALRPFLEARMSTFWLARIGYFYIQQATGKVPDLDARIDAFADRIAAKVQEGGADEVLVVGHSAGCLVAVSACARALRLLGKADRRLSFLTLGHAVPCAALHPKAVPLRAELLQAAADPRLDWLDITSPADFMCFALTDPLLAVGIEQPDPANPKPKIVQAHFARLFAPADYARIKRDFYRMHFQYLMASDLPGEYDYFQITAGNQRLAGRYADRANITGYNRLKPKRR
jgi:pimeloyl-ACP methyl ester carboxylesterase